ncbi:Dipeptidyl aminopeptidase 4 [bacterium HR08]|nr:Dipeptidyl aminopeptidase 4 [bacterium HR08]
MKQKVFRLGIITFSALIAVAGVPAGIAASRVQEKDRPFSIEAVLSAPFPSDLIAAPQGDRVAWVFNAQGRRNIWVADGPDFKARQVTAYTEDDGQELGQLAFSPDGSVLVYVRGGPPNREGEVPNPTSDPRGARQLIMAVRVADGKAWEIAEGSNPRLSPRGDLVAFERRGRIFVAPLMGGERERPLFEARGRNGSPVWSPDGTKLAFVSARGDHSFIGVFDLERKQITWIAPSVDRDREPVWSPDGRRLAFIRIPGAMADPPRTREWELPFSLYVADVETGEARLVWASPNATAGFAQTYPAEPLRWAASDRLVFYSEHEGWMHLYSVPVSGGKETVLTPGEFEVEDSTLSPDGRVIVFNSNQDDIDRRHLWRVNVDGTGLRPLTRGTGIEWSPVITAERRYTLCLSSTARRPAAPALVEERTTSVRVIAPEAIPRDFPEQHLVEPQPVIVKAPDGLSIHCQLFLPPNARAGDRRPAVIFLHGGPIRQMLLGWHPRGYYHRAYGFNQYLASQGYVVLSVNFRSGIGYGRAFRLAPNQGPRGASEYQDVVAAAKYLQRRPEVDPHKIGLWGGSYGGYLTALGLARNSDLFAAGVDLHGVHDWSLRARLREGGGGWGIQGQDLMRLAWESSPVASVRFWYSPVLFIHGDDDRNVDFIETTDLIQRLRAEGKAHVEQLIFPDEVHDFLLHRNWIRAYRAAAEFFDRFLKGSQP